MNISVTSLLHRRARLFRALAPALSAVIAPQAFGLSTYPRGHHISCSVSWATNCWEPAKYLALVGVIPLRFALPPEPATERPMVVLPPAPLKSVAPEMHETSAVTPVATTAESHPSEPAKLDAVNPTPDSKPVSILPDDTPRDVKAEDVLPYFRMPKNNAPMSGMSLPFTPASPTLPASSATYELK